MTQIKTAQQLHEEKIQAEEEVMMAAMTTLIHRHNLHHELGLEIQRIAKERGLEDDFRELAGPSRGN